MRIDRTTPPVVQEVAESRVEPAKREVKPGVVVTTSELSAKLAEGRSARAARVDSLRAKLAGGGYSVDRQKLAERMADDELAERKSQ